MVWHSLLNHSNEEEDPLCKATSLCGLYTLNLTAIYQTRSGSSESDLETAHHLVHCLQN